MSGSTFPPRREKVESVHELADPVVVFDARTLEEIRDDYGHDERVQALVTVYELYIHRKVDPTDEPP